MTKDCVFCQIVARALPAHVVHEDERCLAFLDIRPVTRGALMVIPKSHIDEFCDLPDDDAAHIVVVAQRISRAIRDELKPLRVGLAVAGFGVSHAHLHVVPMYGDQDVTSASYARSIDGMVVFSASHVPVAEAGEQVKMAVRLRERLG